jgi:formylmethanofuran dehydrogenase subunit D
MAGKSVDRGGYYNIAAAKARATSQNGAPTDATVGRETQPSGKRLPCTGSLNSIRAQVESLLVPVAGGWRMAESRFTLHSIRTSKQGQQINVGKDHAEYEAIVNTLTMHPDDMKSLKIAPGAKVRIRTKIGEATFFCQQGKVPLGMIFVPYGPPTCRLYGGETDGTGMPTTKGWEVEVEVVAVESAP